MTQQTFPSTGLPSSSLEPPETNPQQQDELARGRNTEPGSLSETFRHSGWKHNRELVYQALRRTRQPDSRLLSFTGCGFNAYVYRTVDPPFEYKLGGSSCHDRFCLPCAQARSRVLAQNVLLHLDGKVARFITLTLKQGEPSLPLLIARLSACFRKLRTKVVWKKCVRGGCAFTEVKYSANTGNWNVHLHCVVHGIYFPQSDLSAQWYRVTKDSFITDIRVIRDEATIARYVTEYASKPFSNTYLNRPDLLDQVVQALRGTRLCCTFGTWRGLKLTDPIDSRRWIALAPFDSALRQAARGNLELLQAVRFICGEHADTYMAHASIPRAPPPPPPTPSQPSFRDWNGATPCF